MKEVNQKKAVLYCRVSSKEQEETGYSLPAQEKLLREYADRKGLEIVKIFSVAESASGTKQRQVFGEMMEYLKKKGIPHLLTEKVDRITRNLKEAVVVNDWVEEEESRQVHFVKQNLVIHRHAKSDEKFRWDIEIVLAKKHISNLSEEVKKGQKEKLDQGWLPTKPPLGYITHGEKGKKIHVVDETTAPHIRRMFEVYATGSYSLASLNNILHEEGFRTRGGAKVPKSRLHELLRDPFYIGKINWKGLEYQGKQEPLVSEGLFRQVQNVLSGGKTPHQTKRKFIFKKMITCAICGGTVTGDLQKGHVYYHCNYYRGCPRVPYVREEVIEAQLLDIFGFFQALSEEEAKQVRAEIRRIHNKDTEYQRKAISGLQERARGFQRRLDNLYNDRLDERITLEKWEAKNHQLVEEKKEVEAQLSNLESNENTYFDLWLNILELAQRAKDIYSKRSPEEKRLLMSQIFSNLTLKDDKVLYSLKKPLEVLAHRLKQASGMIPISEPEKTHIDSMLKGVFNLSCPILLRGQDSNL